MKAKLAVCLVWLIFASAGVGSLDIVSLASADQGYADDWPMLQHDLTHSGVSSSKAPNTNAVLWSYLTHSSSSSPVVANGSLYTGSGFGYIYCLDAATGQVKWQYETKNAGMAYTTPAVINDRLYLGCSLSIFCMNCTMGTVIWNQTIPVSEASGCPAIVGDRLYTGSLDNNTYCLNAFTGETIWKFTTNGTVTSAPTVVNGVVYIGSYDYNVYALNASTGEKIWNFKAGNRVYAHPTFFDNKIYIGSSDLRFYCLDASTGDCVWSKSAGGVIYGGAAAANGKVYFGSYGNATFCLNAVTGEEIWHYTMGNIGNSPAIADGKVYVGSTDHKIYCLNADEGSLIWSYVADAFVHMSPAIANGIVYIGSGNRLYAFGSLTPPTPDPTTAPTQAPTPLHTSNPTPKTKSTPNPTPTTTPTSSPTIPEFPLLASVLSIIIVCSASMLMLKQKKITSGNKCQRLEGYSNQFA